MVRALGKRQSRDVHILRSASFFGVLRIISGHVSSSTPSGGIHFRLQGGSGLGLGTADFFFGRHVAYSADSTSETLIPRLLK